MLLLLLLLLPDVVQNDTGSPNWKQPSEHWNAKPFKALIPPRFGWRYGASSDGGLKSILRLQDQQYFQHFGCLLSSDELTVETRNEWSELLAVVSVRSPKQKRKVSAANSTDIEKDTRQNKRKNSNETKRNEATADGRITGGAAICLPDFYEPLYQAKMKHLQLAIGWQCQFGFSAVFIRRFHCQKNMATLKRALD